MNTHVNGRSDDSHLPGIDAHPTPLDRFDCDDNVLEVAHRADSYCPDNNPGNVQK